jgi:cytochrome c peroxidase
VTRKAVQATVLLAIIFGSLSVAASQTRSTGLTADEESIALTLSPLPPAPSDPDNPFEDRADAVELGRALFFEPRLSRNEQISCASCHQPNLFWSDGKSLPTANGMEGLRRTPSLINVAYNRWFMWDGRASSLSSQAMLPLENAGELNADPSAVRRLLKSDKDLKSKYVEVFGHSSLTEGMGASPPNATARDVVMQNIGRALAAFQKTIVYNDAPFDRYVKSLRGYGPAPQEFGDKEIRGLKLFVGKARCISCHGSPFFSDKEFHNIRLPGLRTKYTADIGRYAAVTAFVAKRISVRSSDNLNEAAKLMQFLVPRPVMIGAFKTPSLRNVEVRSPYMHQGQYQSLCDVVEHYSSMTDAVGPDHDDDPLMQPLQLADTEEEDLVAFLRSLTDYRLTAPATDTGCS